MGSPASSRLAVLWMAHSHSRLWSGVPGWYTAVLTWSCRHGDKIFSVK